MRVSRAQARLACGRFGLLRISRPLKCTNRKMRRMNCSELRDIVAKYSVESIEHVDTRAGCRIELPISEPGGDSIGVIVQELGDGYRVHDGGHIGGLLFQAGPRGAAPADTRAVRALLRAADLSEDPESGIAFVDTDADSTAYWAYEIGRVIAVAASIAPSRSPARSQSAAGDEENRSSADRRDGVLAADAPIGAGSLPAAVSDATS